jgi:hypothetical protein
MHQLVFTMTSLSLHVEHADTLFVYCNKDPKGLFSLDEDVADFMEAYKEEWEILPNVMSITFPSDILIKIDKDDHPFKDVAMR